MRAEDFKNIYIVPHMPEGNKMVLEVELGKIGKFVYIALEDVYGVILKKKGWLDGKKVDMAKYIKFTFSYVEDSELVFIDVLVERALFMMWLERIEKVPLKDIEDRDKADEYLKIREDNIYMLNKL